MKIVISSLKKALLTIAFMATVMVGKVFAQASEYSAFFKKQYTSTTNVADDLAKGKLALVHNVDTLRFINLQIENWNNLLVDQQVKKDDGSFFQLESNFNSMSQARPYFSKILRNHCTDVQLSWNEGDFLVSRINKKTGEISYLERGNYAGETITTLRTKTFSEVSDADGDAGKPDVYGFSLICGNGIKPKKPKRVERFVPKQQEVVITPIVSAGYEVTYKPISDGTFTSSGGTNTYNVYNTVNNPPPPPPPAVDKHPNRGILISAVIGLATTTAAILLNRRMQQSYPQPVMYSPQVYPYSVPNPVVTNPPPIQGNTGTIYKPPIQGNAGNTVGYNPIQGVSGGVVSYNPIQGGTTAKQVYDPIQGWIWK